MTAAYESPDRLATYTVTVTMTVNLDGHVREFGDEMETPGTYARAWLTQVLDDIPQHVRHFIDYSVSAPKERKR